MWDFGKVRKGSAHRPGHAKTRIGRKNGRISMDQYAGKLSSQIRAKEGTRHQKGHSDQPLFRPPAALNDLFQSQFNVTSEQNNVGSRENNGNESVQENDRKSAAHDVYDIIEAASRRPKNPPSIDVPSSKPRITPAREPISDIEPEAWLQMRLLQEEKNKKRTKFTEWPPVSAQTKPKSTRKPVPLNNNIIDRPQLQENIWEATKSWAPQHFSPVDKAHTANVERVEKVGQALARFLPKVNLTERLQVEKLEYEQCKSKVDNNISLTKPEYKRLADILRNVERREYRLSVGEMLRRKGEEQEEDKKVDQHDQNRPILMPRHDQGTNLTELSSPWTPTQEEDVPEKSISNGLAINKGQEMTSTEVEAFEECFTSDEENECTQEYTHEPLWLYNVYRTDHGNPDKSSEPVFISSHLSKSSAETTMRNEIKSCYGNLIDRTRMEFHVVVDQEFQEQVIEWASGRSVALRVERELVEAEVRTIKRRKKLHCLPTKIYTVVEQVTTTPLENYLWADMQVSDGSSSSPNSIGDDSSTSPGTKYRQLTECFVLRSDANEQANRLMLEHSTAHLADEEKFDLDITGNLDTDARMYLHELEDGDRLYDRKEVLPIDKSGRSKEVYIQVIEHLLRGPRN